jgi:hypothetical protein
MSIFTDMELDPEKTGISPLLPPKKTPSRREVERIKRINRKAKKETF